MASGEDGLPEKRVRRALAHLGTDSASAPDVPAAVTARIGAALRAAPPPAHAVTGARSPLTRLRVLALIIGIGAAAAALAVGVATLQHDGPPARKFPSGPTAERITVPISTVPGDTPKRVVTRP
jgi:hypothetical protein